MSNPSIKISKTELLSQDWATLKKVTYEYQNKDGSWETHQRESYDRGNGAAILLYNREMQTVILTNQFRLPTYLNGNETGMLVEACAGLLDADNAEDCIRKETEEETGYRISNVQKIHEAYMSPGSVTEMLYFFIAEYTSDMKVSEGGGKQGEQENIEVLELDYSKAIEMMNTGEIKDGKTLILLQYAVINDLI